MGMMKVTKEIEATPEMVESELRAYVSALPKDSFPARAGDMVLLKEPTLQALHALPDMPAYVVAVAPEGNVALVAFYSQLGSVGMAKVDVSQVRDPS